jgi:putative phosphoribosyl transferase
MSNILGHLLHVESMVPPMSFNRFKDRMHAGHLLAKRLDRYAHDPNGIVLALPRGGVPVGFAVSKALGLPLDVMLVRKLGVPGHEELAMGAVASGGEFVVAPDVVQMLGIPEHVIEAAARREMAEIERREQLFRANRPPLQLQDRDVILVDDGLATGSTMLAAVQAARAQNPAQVVVAVPVGAPDTCRRLSSVADEVICLRMPEPFYAVGMWYENFTQTTDEEVIQLLDQAWQDQPGPSGHITGPGNISQQNDHPGTRGR